MSISRRIARPLLASMFVSGGIDAVRNPETKAEAARAVTEPLRDWVPVLPEDAATLVRLNGLVQVGAGLLLATGKFRRLAALALIGSIVPTTYAGHRFWEEEDEATRAQQRVHFLKNLGLLGGLILAAVDTEGAPSLGWRAHRQAERVTHVVSSVRVVPHATPHRAEASAAGKKAARRANEAARRAAKVAWEGADAGAHRASAKATDVQHRASRRSRKAADRAGKVARRQAKRANQFITDAGSSGLALAVPYARQLSESTHHAAHAVRETAEPAVAAGVERAEELLAKVTDHLSS
jgi:putative oxidoreductase